MHEGPADVARQLKKASRSWAKVFCQILPGKPAGLEEAFYRETLAYALRRLELHLREIGADGHPWREVRRQCHAAPSLGSGRIPHMLSGPSEMGPADFNREYSMLIQEFPSTGAKGLKEAFKDFCQLTGLGAEALVGEGANLASLVFYFVIHSRAAQQGEVALEAGRALLHALRECRVFFDQKMGRWAASASFAGLSEGEAPPAGLPGNPSIPMLPDPSK